MCQLGCLRKRVGEWLFAIAIHLASGYTYGQTKSQFNIDHRWVYSTESKTTSTEGTEHYFSSTLRVWKIIVSREPFIMWVHQMTAKIDSLYVCRFLSPLSLFTVHSTKANDSKFLISISLYWIEKLPFQKVKNYLHGWINWRLNPLAWYQLSLNNGIQKNY